MNHRPPPPFQIPPPDMAAPAGRDSRDHDVAGAEHLDSRRGKRRNITDDGDVFHPHQFPTYKPPKLSHGPPKLSRTGAKVCIDHPKSEATLGASKESLLACGEEPELARLYNCNGQGMTGSGNRLPDTTFEPVLQGWSTATAGTKKPGNLKQPPPVSMASGETVANTNESISDARLRPEYGVGDITFDLSYDCPVLEISQMMEWTDLNPPMEPFVAETKARGVPRVTPTEELTEADPTDFMAEDDLKTPFPGEKRLSEIAPALHQKDRGHRFSSCSPHLTMLRNTITQENDWQSPINFVVAIPRTYEDVKKHLVIPPRSEHASNGQLGATAKTPGTATTIRPSFTPVPYNNLPLPLLDPHSENFRSSTPRTVHVASITKPPVIRTKTRHVMFQTAPTPKNLYVTGDEDQTAFSSFTPTHVPFTAAKAPPMYSAVKEDGEQTPAHEFASFQYPSPQVDHYDVKRMSLPANFPDCDASLSNLKQKRSSIQTVSLYPDSRAVTAVLGKANSFEDSAKPSQFPSTAVPSSVPFGKPASKDLMESTPKKFPPSPAQGPPRGFRNGSPGLNL